MIFIIKYGIIGAGWRSEFYLRIAELLPKKFSVSGIYIRNCVRQEEFAEKYIPVLTETPVTYHNFIGKAQVAE